MRVVVVVVTALKTFLFIHFFAGKEFCGSQKYFDDDEISSGGGLVRAHRI